MIGTRAACVVAALLLAGCGGSSVARHGPVRVYRIPSGAMEPTVEVGDRVSVEPGAPAIGAIVVYHPSEGTEERLCGPKPHEVSPGGHACEATVPHEDAQTTFIKRVVAGPGDRLYVSAGHVYRQAGGRGPFVREADAYARACGAGMDCNFPVPITVPAGSWYLLGDNRGESDDSRAVGPVPRAWITGVVTAIVWPPPRARRLPHP